MILLRVAGGITVSVICVKNGSNNTSGAVTVVLSTPIAQQFPLCRLQRTHLPLFKPGINVWA